MPKKVGIFIALNDFLTPWNLMGYVFVTQIFLFSGSSRLTNRNTYVNYKP